MSNHVAIHDKTLYKKDFTINEKYGLNQSLLIWLCWQPKQIAGIRWKNEFMFRGKIVEPHPEFIRRCKKLRSNSKLWLEFFFSKTKFCKTWALVFSCCSSNRSLSLRIGSIQLIHVLAVMVIKWLTKLPLDWEVLGSIPATADSLSKKAFSG